MNTDKAMLCKRKRNFTRFESRISVYDAIGIFHHVVVIIVLQFNFGWKPLKFVSSFGFGVN
jgi:hypothetical protein